MELGEVEPHVRVAIDRHKHWTATDHETFSFPGRFKPLREVKLFKQRTNGTRHVFHNLAPTDVFGGWCGGPIYLDGLDWKIRDRARLQYLEVAVCERPFDVLRQAVVEGFNIDGGCGEFLNHGLG